MINLRTTPVKILVAFLLISVAPTLSLIPSDLGRPLSVQAQDVVQAMETSTIVAGPNNTCAITVEGKLLCWGDNEYGQVGDGTNVLRTTPVEVAGLNASVRSVTIGLYHTCALTTAGRVRCWGNNFSGQLGTGNSQNSPNPIDVADLTSNVVSISAGLVHTCALLSTGEVKCWGSNQFGAVGNGSTENAWRPATVRGLGSNVRAIAAGYYLACAVMNNGAAKCWGDNRSGALGDGTKVQRNEPVDVKGLSSGVQSLVSGDYYVCALMTSGAVMCWPTASSPTPTPVNGLASGVTALSGGGWHTCARMNNGRLKCWGNNNLGQLGNGNTNSSTDPIDVTVLDGTIRSVTAGGAYTCILTDYGGAKCWGSNGLGQLGTGSRNNSLTPLFVNGLANRPVVVLVHGWLGFGGPSDSCQAQPAQYGVGADPNYGFFEQIPQKLRDEGYDVYFAHIASSTLSTPSIQTNASCLSAQLDWLRKNRGARSFVLVAHSMGGLVSRAYLESTSLNKNRDVKTLITLGTPHHGTPVNVWLPIVLGPLNGAIALPAYCLLQPAVCQLTVSGATTFNQTYAPRSSGAAYHFVSGETPWGQRNRMGQLTYRALAPVQIGGPGRDDGIVPQLSGLGTYLSGSIDRFGTLENHNLFGPNTYFNHTSSPSALTDCIVRLLRNNGQGTCGSVSGAGLPLSDSVQLSGLEVPSLGAPIEYLHLSQGQSRSRTVGIEGGSATLSASWSTSSVTVSLRDPNDVLIDAPYAASHPLEVVYSADSQGASYTLSNAVPGLWKIVVVENGSSPAGAEVMTMAFLPSLIDLTGALDRSWYQVGSTATVTATLAGTPATAIVTGAITYSGGSIVPVSLSPVGLDTYAGNVTVSDSPGYAQLNLYASGATAGGVPFERTASTLFQIATDQVTLSGTYSVALEPRSPGSAFASHVILSIGINNGMSGPVGVSGDLLDAQGVWVAHAAGTLDLVGSGQAAQLSFSGDEIYESQRNGPYTLTHVVLTDESLGTVISEAGETLFETPAYPFEQFSDGRVFLPVVWR